MTGMKEGAGEDPFAADADTAGASEHAGTEGSSPDARERDGTDRSQGAVQIPYRFRRDGVQDGRDRVPLFVQDDTKRAERDALHELEGRFDDDVSLTDLREALVKAGLQHLDEVESHLEGWGYGMTFEE